MNKLEKKAKEIIEGNIYCTIATASKDSIPWISPVFYGFDSAYNIYWISDKNALHSKHIRENPQVAIVIFNSQAIEGEGDGVYFVATAYELSKKDEVAKGVKIRDSRSKVLEYQVKNIDEVTGSGEWRVYKAVPREISKLTEGVSINGQYIDKREVLTVPFTTA